MAENVNRTISVGVDVGDADQGINLLRTAGTRMFDNMRQSAEGYSKSLFEQSQRVNELIKKEKDLLDETVQSNRMQAQMAADKKLSAIDPYSIDFERKKNKILEEQRKELKGINQEYREQKIVIGQAAKEAGGHYAGAQKGDGGGGSRFSGVSGRFGGVAQGLATGAGIGAVISAVPLIGQAMAGMVALAERRESGERSLEAMTGRGAGSGIHLGIDAARMSEITKQVAVTRGFAGGSLAKDVISQLNTEKAFGMQEGQLMNMGQYQRFGAGNAQSLTQDLIMRAKDSKLWEIDKGDFSALGEKMGHVGSLMERELQTTDDLSKSSSIQLLEGFGKLGGGFAGRGAADRIGSIDEAIKGGGNQYVQAEIFAALQEESPEKSIFRLRQRAGKGVFGKGNMEAILDRVRKRYGAGTERSEQFLATMIPSLASNPEALQRLLGAEKGTFDFDGMSEEERKAKMIEYELTSKDLSNKGGGATSGVSVINAALTDFASGAGVGMAKTLEPTLKSWAASIGGFDETVSELKESASLLSSAASMLLGTSDAGKLWDWAFGKNDKPKKNNVAKDKPSPNDQGQDESLEEYLIRMEGK